MKKSIFLFMLVPGIWSLTATAQISAPPIQWQNTIGGSYIDELYDVIQTTDGGYLLGGKSYFGASADKTEPGYGRYDYWVVKLDASGAVTWERSYGGDLDDQLNKVLQTPDGGYLLAGYSYSGNTGNKTTTAYGDADYWLVKLDNLGDIEWQQSYGGKGADWLTSLASTADSGFILGGTSGSGISGIKTEPASGQTDYWVIKTDSKGVLQWQNTIGGNRRDYLFAIEQTTDDGYIIGGQSWSPVSGDKTEAKIGGTDFWVVKLDSAGSIVWENTIGSNQTEAPKSIHQTPDEGYIIGGYSNSAGLKDKTEDCKGETDYWVIKLSAGGIIEWDRTIGGSHVEYLNDVALTNDGGYIIGGESLSGISGDKNEPSRGGYDYWVVKINSTGTIIWQKTLGGSGFYDILHAIRQCSDGGYILAGFSDSGLTGDKTEAGQGAADYWVVKLEPLACSGWTVYVDADNDGYGDPDNNFFSPDCILPPGYITDGTDCNDADPDIHPMVFDICYNNIDENCDGLIDENCICAAPVNLSIVSVTPASALLSWSAAANAISYKVQFKQKKTDTWTTIKVEGTNTVEVTGLDASTEYAWQVKSRCVKNPDVLSDWSKKNFFITGALKESLVTPFSLEIYPNPASGNTTLHFNLPDASRITLQIFDVNGKQVQTVIDKTLAAGDHAFQINTATLSQGIYFVRMTTMDGTMNQKLIVE
ncbi:MAG: T9SS type A sorting domain-containing protein [Chitinophagales bacterium]|nr:T9SS type A sorting domain-containing protein [Chitinophagales bacterium]